jgi:hypothetical protein
MSNVTILYYGFFIPTNKWANKKESMVKTPKGGFSDMCVKYIKLIIKTDT